ncbi:hypothetical protein N7U66_16740 [Lacinutrix neustonica]|uniref:Apea-like HEPN domain-containing protein n=1 Tax=Lacinutrix neustonica TaxID=2980107 RepID=A0A9E8SDU0_9FLAO|nr:hypothetical protein [Lacinutrix neustonica]WAC01579.1 hypothetical protein N7U66_16740 [Lacinutrix neustonica]
MKYPTIESDLLIHTDRKEFKLYTDKVLIENLKIIKPPIEISVNVVSSDETDIEDRDWIYNSSLFDLYASTPFIENHVVPVSESLTDFLSKFDSFLEIFKSMTQIEGVELAPFSLYFELESAYILKFLFHPIPKETDYVTMLKSAFETIAHLHLEKESELKTTIENSYSRRNNKKYLTFLGDGWKVLNPLLEVGKEITQTYRKDRDWRVKKPHIMLNQDNFIRRFIFDSNWVLVFDHLETMLIQPNDVALYSNIADRCLNQAMEFYGKVILPRHKQWHGSFPSLEKQKEYYDYFEIIIQAVIFAYTALEAFANICIPAGWEYQTETNGVKTIYSKEAIERKFQLREKFKKIIRPILNTPDPSLENWWMSFTELENLRNEIIHTKQSKSEERYAKLLSKSVFDVVKNHKKIIQFYGEHISRYKTELLEEYPYEFGFDDVIPGLMTNKNYWKSYKSIHNINLDKSNEEE